MIGYDVFPPDRVHSLEIIRINFKNMSITMILTVPAVVGKTYTFALRIHDDAELVSPVSNFVQGRFEAQVQPIGLMGGQITGPIIGLLLALIISTFIVRRRRKRY